MIIGIGFTQKTSKECAHSLCASTPPSPVAPTYVRAVNRRNGECEPANSVVSAPDDSPLHLQLQELVQERARSVRSPSVVKEIDKLEELLVSAVDVEIGVFGELTES